jgi:hypothetical protein
LLIGLGMTYNVAIALACHIDPSTFNLDPIQSEERRRCWAGPMMLYTIQNTALGNPDPSWKISHDVRLPADMNDSDITLSGIQETFIDPTQMSYLLFKFKLYDLAAQICRQTCGSSEPTRAATKISINKSVLYKRREIVDTWPTRPSMLCPFIMRCTCIFYMRTPINYFSSYTDLFSPSLSWASTFQTSHKSDV